MTTVNDNRPVNLDLGTIKLPLPALVSITTRVTGVALFFGMGIMLYLLDASLASEASFAATVELMSSGIAKLIIFAIVAALIYHAAAGVKHLVNDLGVGETLEGGILGSRITIAVSAVLIVLAGLWIW